MSTSTGTGLATAKRWSWATVEHGWKAFTVFLAIIGLLWSVGKPYAETFIKDTVKTDLSARIGKIEDATTAQKTQLTTVETQLKGIEAAQAETNRNVRALLLNLSRTRGWISEPEPNR